jgi:hypothetical protein
VCSATFRESKARMGQIDDGIRQLAVSEPASHAAARIIAEVRAWRERAWWAGRRWQMAALSGLVIVAGSFMFTFAPVDARRKSLPVIDRPPAEAVSGYPRSLKIPSNRALSEVTRPVSVV